MYIVVLEQAHHAAPPAPMDFTLAAAAKVR